MFVKNKNPSPTKETIGRSIVFFSNFKKRELFFLDFFQFLVSQIKLIFYFIDKDLFHLDATYRILKLFYPVITGNN